MAETFGEADVILRGRLDLLLQDLDESERIVIGHTERLAQAQAEAVSQIVVVQQQAERGNGSLAVSAVSAYGAWKSLRTIIRGVRLALMAIPAVATTVSAALSVVAVGGAVVLAGAIGLLGDKMLRTQDAAEDMLEAFGRMDGSQQRAIEFAEALERIPVIGRAMANIFLLNSDAAGQADRALASVVATIEDGRVEVGLMGRAINGLINITTPGIIARLLGFDIDIVGDIREVNAELERMQQLMEVRGQSIAIAQSVMPGSDAAARSAQRDAALAAAEGVERVRLQEQFRHDDAMRAFDAEQRKVREGLNAQIEAIRERGGSARRVQEQIDQALHDARATEAAIEKNRLAAAANLERAAQTRIHLAEQEQAKQEQIKQIEAERAAAAKADAQERLRAATAAANAEAGGDSFGAQRIGNEAQRQQALRDAVREGNEDRIDLINAFYDAQAALVDRREREQMDRDEQLARDRAAARIDAQERLRAATAAAQVAMGGDEAGADRIRNEAQRQQALREAMRSGQREQLDLINAFYDTQEELIDRRERERREQQESDQLQTNERLRSEILQARLRLSGQEVQARQEAIRQRFQEMIDRLEAEGNKVGADLARKLRDKRIEEAEQGANQTGRRGQFQQVSLSRIALDGPAMTGQDQRLQREANSHLKTIEQNTRPTSTTATAG